eukprot:3637637-Pyramimonas_sp.AAC.1
MLLGGARRVLRKTMLHETACFVHQTGELFNHQRGITFAHAALVDQLFEQDRIQKVVRDPRRNRPSAVVSTSVQMK